MPRDWRSAARPSRRRARRRSARLATTSSHADPRHYEPTNITFGIMPPLDAPPKAAHDRAAGDERARARRPRRTWVAGHRRRRMVGVSRSMLKDDARGVPRRFCATTATCRRTRCAPTTPICRSCSTSLAARDGVQAERGAPSRSSTPTASARFSRTCTIAGSRRSSAARRLAALRTFARYLVREEQLDDDPTALVGAPRKEQTLPAHLAIDGDGSAAGQRPTSSTVGRPPRPGDSRAVLRVRPAAERAGRSRSRGRRICPAASCACAARAARNGWCRSTSRRPRRSARCSADRVAVERPGRPSLEAARNDAGVVVKRAGDMPLFLNLRGGRLTTRSVDRIVRQLRAPGGDRARASARTRSGTRSRRTCCRPARICARFRNCWATRG